MIEIEGPDGTIYEFPEGTSEEVMRKALQQVYGAPKEDAGQSEAMTAGLADLSEATRNPPPPERGVGQILYDNLIGDPNDGVQSHGEALGTWLNRAGESMTLGTVGDEASAAAYSLLPGRSYEGELARFRQNEENMSEWGRLSADFSGALVPALAGVGVVSKAPSLGKAVLRGAGLGAAAGATQGFMEGEGGFPSRILSGAGGGLLGGVLGGSIPVVAEVGKHAVRAGQDMLRNSRISGEIGNALGISPQAGNVVGNALAIDDPAAMRAALANSDAMLADASPEMTMYLRGAMRTPNPGSRIAAERVEARAAGAYDDLMRAINPSGPPTGVSAAMDGIRSGSAGARSSAYNAAYAAPIDYASEQGAKLLDDISPRLPAKAVSYANELMRLKGEKSAQIMASIADDGTVTFTRPPDVRQWDYIKQALDQLAESGEGAGALGGQTRLGSAYQSLAREVRDAVADLVPEYRTALDTASDAIGRRNAVQFGADILSPRVTTEEALGTIGGATAAEREAMKTGFRGQMEEVLGNVRAAATDQNIDARQAMTAFKSMSSPNAQKKLAALFGDEWPGIKDQFDKAGRALGLRANTSANSATAANLFFDRTVQDAVQPGALRSGNPMAAVRDFIGGLTGASPNAINRLSGEVKAEIADLLTRGDAQNSLGVILNALAGSPANPNAGRATYNALAGVGFTALPSGVAAGLNLLGQ